MKRLSVVCVDMADKRPTFLQALRAALWAVLAIAITVLFIMGGVSLSRAEYGLGSIFLALGAGLAVAFFRKNISGLLIMGLIWIAVNAGLTGIFHPTILGIFVTVGSTVGIVLLVRWKTSKR